ncbi:MAG: beta-ketoacyl-[acyl-carrier-protein] synthase family protein [Acidobacteriota bacterium]
MPATASASIGAPAPNTRRRIVVTGLGVATALGLEVDSLWYAVDAGRCGIAEIRQLDASRLPVRLGAEVDVDVLQRRLSEESGEHEDPVVAANRTLLFALWAARRAWAAAGLSLHGCAAAGLDPRRAGVVVGAGVFPAIETMVPPSLDAPDDVLAAGVGTAHRDAWRAYDLGLVSDLLSSRLGLGGPSITLQAACTSGTQAIGEALRRLRRGQIDLALTGGADSMMSLFAVTGFTVLGALSRNPDPATASRPFDARRDGFVLGEGAGLLVLEELEHARRRGATILAEVRGYGASADAYRFTDMDPDARGAIAALHAALTDADLTPDAIDHVNAHGTSTPQNDRMETLALHEVFGDHAQRLAVSANKSQLGHLLCAAGGIEAVLTVLALHHQRLPPTLGLHHSDPDCDLDYVAGASRAARIRAAVSSSFGFGGQNGCLVLTRPPGDPEAEP